MGIVSPVGGNFWMCITRRFFPISQMYLMEPPKKIKNHSSGRPGAPLTFALYSRRLTLGVI
jgi:hypothetical protein